MGLVNVRGELYPCMSLHRLFGEEAEAQTGSTPRFLVARWQGENWVFLDRWTQPGGNLSLGRFGFYIPGNDQVALSSFGHYVDLNTR